MIHRQFTDNSQEVYGQFTDSSRTFHVHVACGRCQDSGADLSASTYRHITFTCTCTCRCTCDPTCTSGNVSKFCPPAAGKNIKSRIHKRVADRAASTIRTRLYARKSEVAPGRLRVAREGGNDQSIFNLPQPPHHTHHACAPCPQKFTKIRRKYTLNSPKFARNSHQIH